MAMIKFWRGNVAPASKDADTLYFVKESGQLYLGNNLIADVTKLDTAQVEQILGDALSSYYTKSAIDGIVETINGEIAKKVDQTAYDTKIGAIESAIAGKADASTAALKSEVQAVDAKFADYTKTEDLGALASKDGLTAGEVGAYTKEEVNSAISTATKDMATNAGVDKKLAGKVDVSVYNAYVAAHEGDYTNAQIDAAIDADVKVVTDYISNNEAKWSQNDNTTYALSYDNTGDVPYIVLTPSVGEATKVDATEFIKDGMIDSVALSEDGLSLVITWNTDAGKNSTTIPLSGLVDIYTGVEGARVTVSVSSDDKISADLVAGSISKNYLDSAVQASLGLADSAVQPNALNTALEPYAKTADQKGITDAISNRVTAIENLGLEAGTTYAKASDVATLSGKVGTLEGKVDVEKVSTAIANAVTDMATNSSVDTKLAAYTKTADLGDLAGKDEADLGLDKYAVAADIAGSLAKADSAVQPAAIADMLTKTEAGNTYQVKGDYEVAGAAAAVQGATTNTVKDCVDAINTMNNQVGDTVGTVQNIVSMLTWIEG